jgi:cytochrome c oxidase assembly protein subunit 15
MPVSDHQAESTHSPWPHRWALVLACATFPLIWVGGLVTTTDAGMAVPDWPTTYGYNLFLYPLGEWFFGPWDLFIEHGHRLFGALVGMLTIGLVIVLWRCEPRRWVQVFGLVLLVGVIAQGVLGGLRVRMNEEALAMLHGCTGPAFFALCAAMAAVTSLRWRAADVGNVASAAAAPARRLLPLAAATALVAYLQLAVGAQLRHVPATAQPETFQAAVHLHLLLAAVVLLHAAWLAVAARRLRQDAWLSRPPLWLFGLVVLQIFLGATTWLFKFGMPTWARQQLGEWDFAVPAASRLQSLIVTGHVATGSLIVAVAVVACLRLGRAGRIAGETRAVGTGRLETAL